jgi:hypothetical protein
MRIVNLQFRPTNYGTPRMRIRWSDRILLRLGRFMVAAICLTALLCVAGMATAARAESSMEENEAKTALLLKILPFVKWPVEANHELVIGFVGADAASYAMHRLGTDKDVNGKHIIVRRLEPDGDLKSCQVLYIGASQAKNMTSLLDRVRGSGILTVGEMEGFGQRGGVVNLLLNNGRIRFEVNPNSAERAHLQISSRILSLATLVSDGT